MLSGLRRPEALWQRRRPSGDRSYRQQTQAGREGQSLSGEHGIARVACVMAGDQVRARGQVKG